ncbi:hypothetical protein CERSUDRAFT_106459 [Gelatoporia subvermispora B]|uniref:Alpha/beta hydrolase fold-3 domain-containing protein n=1 Tax=Ceriporiopsis subvermispora (strain B) TaxID=914234 RepID=M2PHZ8_CERS8|nr:hypothetical protein CERSUDRAFT_106459 [Gelatoporia subvermispora B]
MAFVPLLEQRRAEIESIRCESYQYGPTNRHMLDMYYPPTTSITGGVRAPVLFLAYGGGFGTGERAYRSPIDLIYRNVGAFFAQHGICFVVPDYRLVPDAKFPQPAEDLRDAICWLVDHAEDVADLDTIDIENIFVLGHCTGANLIMTMLLLPGMLSPGFRPRIRGIMLMGGLYSVIEGGRSVNHAVIAQYYGDKQQMESRAPLALLTDAPDEVIQKLPNILLLLSEREPPDIDASNDSFVAVLLRRLIAFDLFVMEGHNHISPEPALGTGQGEEWATRIIRWMGAKLVHDSVSVL